MVEKHLHCRKGAHCVEQQLAHYWCIDGLCSKTERDTMQFVREASNLGVAKGKSNAVESGAPEPGKLLADEP